MSAKDLQELAQSLASVATVSKELNVLIFGAGLGGLAMLEVLGHTENIDIHAIVDINPDAPGFYLARELNIPTSTDIDKSLASFRGDIIIDVTGDKALYHKLLKYTAPHETELVSAKSAKLLYDLANRELRNEHTIESQNTRLSLLDSLLEITLQLEHRPPLDDLTLTSFEKIHRHTEAVYGAAVLFNNSADHPLFVGAIGIAKPDIPAGHRVLDSIASACRTIRKTDRYKIMVPEISMDQEVSFNTVLPVWQDEHMAGALLFNIPLPHSKEQINTLKMASAHLSMAFKTLDYFEQLEKMAIFDALTNIYNRRKFDMQIKKEINRIRRIPDGVIACGFIDLDDFKLINDSCGHAAGDLVLKHIASSIESSIRDYDICARYGGDEFVILMPADSAMTAASLKAIGSRIMARVKTFSSDLTSGMKISVSIGLAMLPGKAATPDALLKLADQALYQAKHAGKGCMRIASA